MKRVLSTIYKFMSAINNEFGWIYTLGGEPVNYKNTIANPEKMQRDSWHQAINSVRDSIDYERNRK